MKEEIPLEKKYLSRKPGGLQIRATALRNSVNMQTGAVLIDKIAEICRHTGQYVIETMDAKLSFVRSFEHAVPILNPTAKRAREINSKGLNGNLVDPQRAAAELVSRKN